MSMNGAESTRMGRLKVMMDVGGKEKYVCRLPPYPNWDESAYHYLPSFSHLVYRFMYMVSLGRLFNRLMTR